jgi:hypothetical protein
VPRQMRNGPSIEALLGRRVSGGRVGTRSRRIRSPVSDIFISYASEDRSRVRPLADALSGHGWSVWWDRQIHLAGRSTR